MEMIFPESAGFLMVTFRMIPYHTESLCYRHTGTVFDSI